MEGYSTEEDSKDFQSDRKFSNVVMFISTFAMAVIFMASNVIHLKKQQEN